jgi:hypothetical protein
LIKGGSYALAYSNHARAIGGKCFVGCGAAMAVPYHVSVDTSALGTSSFLVAFDLIDGGSPSNSVAIAGFTTEGTLGVATPTGGVTGALPGGFTLADTSFFNEYLQGVQSANALAFDFEASTNAPAPGSAPDTFSFFQLDSQSGLPLFGTTDTTASDSLFTLEIDGSQNGQLAVFQPTTAGSAASWSVTAASQPIPEPATPLLLGAAILTLTMIRGKRKV